MLRDDLHLVLLEHRKQRTVVGRILEMYQFMCFLCNLFQLLGRCKPGNVFFVVFCMNHVLQRSDTDHKKFIQIR